jgi:replication factor C small subunit
VDYIRDKVVGFAETMPYGRYKYIILDEADFLSASSQAALRGIMQDYAETTRFILTCNYVGKILPAILSRCPPITIDTISRDEYVSRAAEVMIMAGVDVSTEEDITNIEAYAAKFYPDLRLCINEMQLHCVGGKISPFVAQASGSENEIFMDMLTLFNKGKIKDARLLLCKNLSNDQYVNGYRFLYDNVELFSKDEEHECSCLAIIKEGLVDHATSGDAEICLIGTVAKLFIA